ncbi:major facilitator superfamily transporter [Rhizodiscina lignyota]|uniref:Major facilitator superfamily transporter n=1 Tax=Rhizodiscina lignyota TaxID=1504668 RepID=A0A9P4ICK0_9PEZI|nr:major facilitator superfamily transporter [Rhizodiscina lignyota]
MEHTPELNPSPSTKGEVPTSSSSGVISRNPDSRDAPVLEENNYISGIKLAIVVAALCVANFFVALDITILGTAIPRISTQFNSLQDVGWYASAYLLTDCSFQLLFGKLYTHFDIKTIFVGAMTIFEIGSLLNGVAPNSPVFILGRAIAGVGAAGAFAGALIIIIHSVPAEKRAQYSGMIVGMYGLASVAAPLTGGAFTDHVTWRWCFYINLPCGGVAIAGILFFFKSPKLNTTFDSSLSLRARIMKFDPFGTTFFLGSITCLLLALQLGGSTYNFTNARIIVLFILFGLLMIAFLLFQFWEGNATIPPRVLKQRTMLFGSFYMFCSGAQFLIFVYYLPIWFQGVRGTSAIQSGIRTLPHLLGSTLMVVFSGVMVSITGHYIPFMWASVVLGSIGAGLLTTLKVDSSSAKWIGYQIITGIGNGLGYQQGITAAQTVLEGSDMNIGTAMMVFVQLLGGTIFVSASNNVFDTRLVKDLRRTVPDLDPESVLKAGATGLRKVASEADLPKVLVAYNNALTKTFEIGLIFACLGAIGAAGMEWRTAQTKERQKEGSQAEGSQTPDP